MSTTEPRVRRRIHRLPLLRRASAFGLLGLVAAVLGAQTETEAPGLQDRLDAFVESSGIPGLGAALVHVDRPAEIAVAGHRTSAREIAVTTDDLWHLGSISKSFTSTLVGRLIESDTKVGEAALDWDTPLGALLADARGTPFESVPLERFLDHRSGLVANPPPPRFVPRDTETPIREQRTEISREMLEIAPVSEPGTEMLYSNGGYIVAGTALEHLLDATWEELVRRQVFSPLGLDSGGFGPPGSVDSVDQPRGHSGAANDALRPVPPTPLADNPAFLGPAGTIHMDLEDLATYARAHLAGERGEDGVLSADTFRRLHAPDEGQNYALGWIRFVGDEGPAALFDGDLLMHNGSNTIWYAIVFLAPEEGAGVAVTTNAGLHNARDVNRFAIDLLQTLSD